MIKYATIILIHGMWLISLQLLMRTLSNLNEW